jgi:2-methylcitrate dehydratase
MSPSSREYDPEIKDIADYVANKAIDSELAVSFGARGC